VVTPRPTTHSPPVEKAAEPDAAKTLQQSVERREDKRLEDGVPPNDGRVSVDPRGIIV
jgi:hypothetical protein